MTNKKLRQKITRLCNRIEAGKYKCRCGGILKMDVMTDGKASGERLWLHCSREMCCRFTRWYAGFNLLEAFKEWKAIQRRKRL